MDDWTITALIFGVAALAYLLYVRQHDGKFWEEEMLRELIGTGVGALNG